MHRGNAQQFRIDLGHECTEMQLFRKLSGVEISHRRRFDFTRIDLRVLDRFSARFRNQIANRFAFLFQVAFINDAATAENNSGSKNIIVYPVACAVPDRAKGAPKLSGPIPKIRLRPGSYLQSYYSQDTVVEEFFCNFEVNPEYEWAAMEAGFPVVARGPQGEIRAIESPTHRFYIATLFQPQLSSKPDKPHPLVQAFVQAAADWGRKKLDDSVLE